MNPLEGSNAWIDRPNRLRVDLTGPDRAKFLNNLATNDIRRLAVGSGCEAFVTSLQGKTLAIATILALEDRLILRTEVDAKALLFPHFQKYGAFDDVAFEDVRESTFEFVVPGREAADRLGLVRTGPPLSHRSGRLGAVDVLVVEEDPTGRGGVTILGSIADAPSIRSALGAEIDAEEFEAMRIEAGTPAFGKDVTAENLPQEIGRDARAISFVKGCYLGQETVARIDALGHVNRILKGLRIDGEEIPAPGTALDADGKPAGKITSSAFSRAIGGPIALAMVRVGHATAGTKLGLESAAGRQTATVVDLPMIPAS